MTHATLGEGRVDDALTGCVHLHVSWTQKSRHINTIVAAGSARYRRPSKVARARCLDEYGSYDYYCCSDYY
jgi:hypothetical protein